MNLLDINYENNADLKVTFKVADSFSVLFCKVNGLIDKGSKGNNSCDYLFGKACQYFVQINPLIFIIDFSELEYTFGDRLSKTIDIYTHLNFENPIEWPVIVIVGDKCETGIKSLLETLDNKNIILVDNSNAAIQIANEKLKDL